MVSSKFSGKLRYITLYLAPKIKVQTMGPGYYKIYVPSPEDLDSISPYIVKAFSHAKEPYKSWC